MSIFMRAACEWCTRLDSQSCLVRLAALLALFFVLPGNPAADAAAHRTTNFIVTAPTVELAREFGNAAEAYRKSLAIEWLGDELPRWPQPCPITTQVGPSLGAGGATSFMFERGQPFGWRMSVQGSRERLLDSVLPHEITHTIFATHFGRPLPRWADEGACTTVEHDSERQKQEQFLQQFLRSSPPRSIPFNRMYRMTEYPHDIMPLYAQGHSVARFLLQQGGKRKFVDYVGAGMSHDDWDRATSDFYGYRDLSDLQVKWVAWVAGGSQRLDTDSKFVGNSNSEPRGGTAITPVGFQDAEQFSGRARSFSDVEQLAAAGRQLSPVPPASGGARLIGAPARSANAPARSSIGGENGDLARQDAGMNTVGRLSDSWYARQRDLAQSANSSDPSSPSSFSSRSMSRPQGAQQARQMVLEWDQPRSTAVGPGIQLRRSGVESQPQAYFDAPINAPATYWR